VEGGVPEDLVEVGLLEAVRDGAADGLSRVGVGVGTTVGCGVSVAGVGVRYARGCGRRTGAGAYTPAGAVRIAAGGRTST